MQRPCAKNLKQIFPEMKLQGVIPNSYIHVSVCDLYIPTISGCSQICGLIVGIYKSLTDTRKWKLETSPRSLISGNTENAVQRASEHDVAWITS
jgi:hypothetical protein